MLQRNLYVFRSCPLKYCLMQNKTTHICEGEIENAGPGKERKDIRCA